MYCIFACDGCISDKGGPTSAEKSYIIQFCQASGWLVLYISTAGDLTRDDNKMAASIILERFLHVEEEKLKDIQFKENGLSLYDLISDG
ncbi:15538_t:CDS:2, partial [Funneliformis mosseae]